MQLHTPSAYPRDDGDYDVRVNWGDGSTPFAIMALSEDGKLALWLNSAEECDRLIRAAVAAKRKLEAARAGAHPYEDDDGHHCGRCGVYRGHAVHQMPFAAAPVASGQPVTVTEDEPDCARPGCGHPRFHHWEFGPTTPSSPASGCDLDSCPCPSYAATSAVVRREIHGLQDPAPVVRVLDAPETAAVR